MTCAERIEAIFKGDLVDQVPFVLKGWRIPQCEAERQLRCDGLGVFDSRPVYSVSSQNTETDTHGFTERGVALQHTRIRTPLGDLTRLDRRIAEDKTEGTSWRIQKLFKGPEDYDALEFLFRDRIYAPCPEKFLKARTMDDWLKIKPRYQFSEDRFGRDWEAIALTHRNAGRVVCVGMPGGFDEPRQLMGEEDLCVAYYEQPELVHDMLDTIGETAVQVLERVASSVQVDLLSVHEDMAGKSGCLIGPSQIDAFVKPYYLRVWEVLKSQGARLFDLDSDGDINTVIPSLLDAGINCIHPMEPAANMDIVDIRKTYGDRLAFYGGIDKHVIRRSQDEIVTELEYKVPPMVESGGCVLALDHRIPNGTPLGNYRFYVEQVWKMLGQCHPSIRSGRRPDPLGMNGGSPSSMGPQRGDR
jgi:hypothetical protein